MRFKVFGPEANNNVDGQTYEGRAAMYSKAAVNSAAYIANHLRRKDIDSEITEDWRYVALVLDRLFLWIFSIMCLLGTCGIILQAPVIFDSRTPIVS